MNRSLTCKASLALASLVALACNSGPDISTCKEGAFYADCGGEGTPRFGCSPDDCRWFVGGNVAAGYEASSCSIEEICCHDGEPFADGTGGPDLLFWGQTPWDASRAMVLEVEQAPELTPTEFRCEDEGNDPELPGCPATVRPEAGIALMRDTLTVFTRHRGDFYGWLPVIEIDPKRGLARVCSGTFTDIGGAGCPRIDRSECADRGVVRLSRSPGEPLVGLLVEVDVYFGSRALRGVVSVESVAERRPTY